MTIFPFPCVSQPVGSRSPRSALLPPIGQRKYFLQSANNRQGGLRIGANHHPTYMPTDTRTQRKGSSMRGRFFSFQDLVGSTTVHLAHPPPSEAICAIRLVYMQRRPQCARPGGAATQCPIEKLQERRRDAVSFGICPDRSGDRKSPYCPMGDEIGESHISGGGKMQLVSGWERTRWYSSPSFPHPGMGAVSLPRGPGLPCGVRLSRYRQAGRQSSVIGRKSKENSEAGGLMTSSVSALDMYDRQHAIGVRRFPKIIGQMAFGQSIALSANQD